LRKRKAIALNLLSCCQREILFGKKLRFQKFGFIELILGVACRFFSSGLEGFVKFRFPDPVK